MAALRDLETPELLLDAEVVERNAERMRRHVAALGLRFRPHVKTAKCLEVVRLMLGEQPGRIVVSTLREAESFLAAGVTDILYAVGVAPVRFERLARLVEAGAKVALITDSLEMARELASFARDRDVTFDVLIELDVGAGRGGAPPGSALLLDIARVVAGADRLRLRGVLTHAGHAYGARDRAELRQIAQEEERLAVWAADRLRESGIEAPEVSIGSTPSILALETACGATEARTGVYIFNDLDQLKLGVCGREDLALSVLSTVIGHNRAARRLLIDAGILALSKDRGLTSEGEVSYGEICDVADLAAIPGLRLANLNQEHGIVEVQDEAAFERLPVGSKVRIVPNHACITAAAYPSYAVVREGEVVARWTRINGW